MVGHKSERYHQRQRQPEHRCPARCPPPGCGFRRREQLLQAHRRQRALCPVDRVVLADQGLGISPDRRGDDANVPAGVEVASASRIVAALDAFDDRFPDPGPLADLLNGQAGPVARLRQGFPDAHPVASAALSHRARPRGGPDGYQHIISAIPAAEPPSRGAITSTTLRSSPSPVVAMITSSPARRVQAGDGTIAVPVSSTTPADGRHDPRAPASVPPALLPRPPTGRPQIPCSHRCVFPGCAGVARFGRRGGGSFPITISAGSGSP